MPSIVNIDPADFRETIYRVRLVLQHVATWGMLNPDSRRVIYAAADDAIKCCTPIASLRGNAVEVTAVKVRAVVVFLERLSLALHSARKVMTDDRRRALGTVAQTKRKLVAYLQLKLF